MSPSDIALVIGGACFVIVGLLLIFNAGSRADRAALSGRENRQVFSTLERVIMYEMLLVPTTPGGGRRLGLALVVVGALGILAVLAGG